MLQMSQWRGGHSGKGGGARKAKALKHGVGRSSSSRPGSTYSLPGSQVRCAGRVVSVWSGGHVRASASYMVILVILL